MIHHPFSRRKFLVLSVAGGAATMLIACGPTSPAAPAAPAAAPAAAEPQLPFEVAAEAVNPFNLDSNVEVDGVFFEGGFGADYIRYAAQLQEQLHPGMKVKVLGIQKITEQLQPRFVSGNPPDVIDNSGANMLPTTNLITEGQVLDLAELMAAPALDTPGKTFAETLFPGSQDSGVVDGKQYGLNIAYTVSGLWYSKPAFEAAGYTYPTTWADFMALCETIKTEGKAAPFTYQGKYPYYVWGIVLAPLMLKAGGPEALIAIDNLEPDAWKNPDVLRAVEDLYQLYDKGYIMPGTAGLTHTESQAEWLQGKATFIPCGTWLENEMKTLTPEGFDMVIGGIPGYADGKGDQNAVSASGGETYLVPSKAANPKHGMEFLRCLMSKASAKYFAENVSAIMPVIGGTEGANVSAGMQSALALADSSGGANVLFRFADWYNKGKEQLEIRTGELMTGAITPAEFVDAMQKTADEIAQDPDTVKFQRES
ncbi:MAG: N-acetylglucosamine/diacetylchitobiose ABC transporter substrate-binding protein [Caldilineaceae bacterium]